MTGTIHKVLVTVSSIAALVGAYIVGADQVPFGLNAFDVGLTLIWIGGITNIVATAIRANWLPGVTTGIGNEGGHYDVGGAVTAFVLVLIVLIFLLAADAITWNGI